MQAIIYTLFIHNIKFLQQLYELSNYFYSQISQHTVQCNKAPTSVACYVEEFAAIYHSKVSRSYHEVIIFFH